jgi:uncharacterized protein DUF892
MQITNFKDMYIAELQELISLERQLAHAFRRMAEVASHPSLKKALMHHRRETQVQTQRLESILQKHGANPRAHTDQAMQALVSMFGSSRPNGWSRSTSLSNATSEPGRRHTATFGSPMAAKPRVRKSNFVVTSRSPTFAGRDATL